MRAAYSARWALGAAADFSQSVALVDLELPDMTGYQFARKLRSHLRGHVRKVPLLASSEPCLLGPCRGYACDSVGFPL